MARRDQGQRDSGAEGWLFVRADAIPERLRARAVRVWFVPLVPREMARLLDGRKEVLEAVIEDEDPRLVALVAKGRSASAISRELGIHPRTAQRRLARLRRRLDVDTTAEVAALLSGAGFISDEESL